MRGYVMAKYSLEAFIFLSVGDYFHFKRNEHLQSINLQTKISALNL